VITGDNTDTTKSIAAQAGIVNTAEAVEGKEIMEYSEEQLLQEVEEKVLFTRMFPDAKLAVVNALKKKEKWWRWRKRWPGFENRS